ncbi:MAG: Rossmann-fold NAD(P)-binding domain-containing protein [Planctomycetota bacterium]|jgi:S-adenosylhomocysteine hydrolase
MIGESVKNELVKRLVTLKSQGVQIGNRALIIGYGSIGRCTAFELRSFGYEVTVFDSNATHRYNATRDGFQCENNKYMALSYADLVVGCTGTSVLDRSDHQFIADGAVLVSTSSSDVEFKGWQIRKSPDTVRILNETMVQHYHPENHPCFNLYRMKQHNKSFYLVNGGFPVNFSGDIDPISPQKIQLTRALLYAGAVQASFEQRPEVHSLNTHMQELILNGYAQCA